MDLATTLVSVVGKTLIESMSAEHTKEKKEEDKKALEISVLSKFVQKLKRGQYFNVDLEIKVEELMSKKGSAYWKMTFIDKRGIILGDAMCEEENYYEYQAGNRRYKGMVRVIIGSGGFFAIEPCNGVLYS